MEVTPEMVLQKIDELIELLKYAENPTEYIAAIHTWRTVLKTAVIMRNHWDKNVVHREERVEEIINLFK